MATMLCIAPMTVAKKPGHRGEREGNRKTIAQGMPVIRLSPVATTLVCSFSSHARLWVLAEAPGIPCALCFRGTFVQRSGRDARRGNGEPCMHPHPAHRSLRSRCATLPARGRDQAAQAVSPIPPPRSAGRVGEPKSALALRASRGEGASRRHQGERRAARSFSTRSVTSRAMATEPRISLSATPLTIAKVISI